MLYIVATPIGNLEDITFRAVRILKEVDLILAEDTRHSKKLLEHYQIRTKIIAFHEHNEKHKTSEIIEKLHTQNIALISDAGTPLINDPGFNLVKVAKENNIEISPIPGVSSVITALSVCGLPTDNFCFLGFIPTKKSLKQKFISALHLNTHTSIFFESPKRILDTICLIADICEKDRQISIAKELTKKFETIITGNAEKILEYLTSDENHQNGEFVVLVSGVKHTHNAEKLLHDILPILSKELSTSQAAKIASKITGIKKKDCYDKLL